MHSKNFEFFVFQEQMIITLELIRYENKDILFEYTINP
jgi:hypothetical protein